MPEIKKYETHDEWIARCVPVYIKEGKDDKQAYAICESQWTSKLEDEPVDKLPTVELLANEDNGVYCISLVESPAIEEFFVLLNKENVNIFLNEDKKIVIAPALIPYLEIYRNNIQDVGPGYIFFSEETVRKVAANFIMKNEDIQNSNINHTTEKADAKLFESWVIEDTKLDKAVKYGFNLPVGTWMVSYKIESDELWNKIKAGQINGFSVEGHFEAGDIYNIDNLEFNKEQLNEVVDLIYNINVNVTK